MPDTEIIDKLKANDDLVDWLKELLQVGEPNSVVREYAVRLDDSNSLSFRHATGKLYVHGSNRQVVSAVMFNSKLNMAPHSHDWFRDQFNRAPTTTEHVPCLEEDTLVGYWYCLGLVSGIFSALINEILPEQDTAVRVATYSKNKLHDTIQIELESDTGIRVYLDITLNVAAATKH